MRRRLLATLSAAVLACAGIGAAIAATATTTGTVSVCATVSTPGHTVGVDGSAVATLAGGSAKKCATTTYTVPTNTVTVTTTTATTTAATTTTAPTTTTSQSPGSVLFDGSAKNMIDLQSHEVCQTCGYNLGPITWPDGSVHYFYRNQTPAIWSCVCFIKDDLKLVSDSVFGKVLNVAVAMGDTNPWHGNKGGTVNGAGQVSTEQPNHLGEWQFYGIAVKVPAWNGPISDLYFVDIASLGYQTSSNDQVALGLWNGPNDTGPLTFDVRVNGGYATGPLGNAKGTTHFQAATKPVTFGQWEEFVYAVKWSTHQDGEVKIYNRRPGGAWSVIFDRAGIDTYLYGNITQPNGTVRNFAQDGSNWAKIIDKIGLYFSEYGGESETVQESGLTISSDLATAESTLP